MIELLALGGVVAFAVAPIGFVVRHALRTSEPPATRDEPDTVTLPQPDVTPVAEHETAPAPCPVRHEALGPAVTGFLEYVRAEGFAFADSDGTYDLYVERCHAVGVAAHPSNMFLGELAKRVTRRQSRQFPGRPRVYYFAKPVPRRREPSAPSRAAIAVGPVTALRAAA